MKLFDKPPVEIENAIIELPSYTLAYDDRHKVAHLFLQDSSIDVPAAFTALEEHLKKQGYILQVSLPSHELVKSPHSPNPE